MLSAADMRISNLLGKTSTYRQYIFVAHAATNPRTFAAAASGSVVSTLTLSGTNSVVSRCAASLSILVAEARFSSADITLSLRGTDGPLFLFVADAVSGTNLARSPCSASLVRVVADDRFSGTD